MALKPNAPTPNAPTLKGPTPFEEALNAAGDGRYNILLTITCGFILLSTSVDLFGFSLVVNAACDLNMDRSKETFVLSMPFVGILLTSYFWGYIADTRGRRFTLVWCLNVGFVLSILCSISYNWIFLGIVKFVAVCSYSAGVSLAFTLVGECCIARKRSRYTLLMSSLLVLAPAISSALAYPVLYNNFAVNMPFLGIVFTPWRLLCIVLALPLGMGGFFIYFFYESPKFLANWGKNEEALQVMKKIHDFNSRGRRGEFNQTILSKLQQFSKHSSKNHVKTINKTTMNMLATNPAKSLAKNVNKGATTWRKITVIRQLIRRKGIYGSRNTKEIQSIVLEDHQVLRTMTFCEKIIAQGAPLFRRPFLFRTLQLYYIVSMIYLVNNSIIVWLPETMKAFEATMDCKNCTKGSLCTMIKSAEAIPSSDHKCMVETSVIVILVLSQSIFAILTVGVSMFPNRRRTMLMIIFALSSVGAVLVPLTPLPYLSIVFLMLISGTCLGMGIMASYFIDMYPTSYRGMVQCLSIMVARGSSFIGVQLVGLTLFSHCWVTSLTFLIFTSTALIATWFLPKDKSPSERPAPPVPPTPPKPPERPSITSNTTKDAATKNPPVRPDPNAAFEQFN